MELATKEAVFLFTILTNMKNTPDVDWKVVASESGYKDAKVARTRFGQIKKKAQVGSGSASASPAKVKKSPAKSTHKRKRPKKEDYVTSSEEELVLSDETGEDEAQSGQGDTVEWDEEKAEDLEGV